MATKSEMLGQLLAWWASGSSKETESKWRKFVNSLTDQIPQVDFGVPVIDIDDDVTKYPMVIERTSSDGYVIKVTIEVKDATS